MEDPVRDISPIIHLLTQSPPAVQRRTIDTYFLPTASFSHPLCRTFSFDGSRTLIAYIYRWYKIMSPTIQLHINSIAFDAHHSILYVNLDQVFSIWAIPFHHARVNLTTVLKLRKDKHDGKYYIVSQEDLYQTDQWVRFFWLGGWVWVMALQFFATLVSVGCTYLFALVSWLEAEGVIGDQKGRRKQVGGGGSGSGRHGHEGKKEEQPEFTMKKGAIGNGSQQEDGGKGQSSGAAHTQEFESSFVEMPKGSGRYVTAPVSHATDA